MGLPSLQAHLLYVTPCFFSLGVPPTGVLSYACLSLHTGIPQDTVQRCNPETLLFLPYTRAKKQGVDFILKDTGWLLLCNKSKCSFPQPGKSLG